MPPINLSDIFPQLICESAANAHVGKNETLDLKQTGTDFCIMHPNEQHGNKRLHIFFMPNIIHINGRLINGCISSVGHIKWVYSVPTGTQTDALRCSNRNRWTRWKLLYTGFAYMHVPCKITPLRFSDHLDENSTKSTKQQESLLVKQTKGQRSVCVLGGL